MSYPVTDRSKLSLSQKHRQHPDFVENKKSYPPETKGYVFSSTCVIFPVQCPLLDTSSAHLSLFSLLSKQNLAPKTRSDLYKPHLKSLPYHKTRALFLPLLSSMESQNIKQRFRDDPGITTTTSTSNDKVNYNEKNRPNRREKRMAMAKRGLRSLAIAVSFPLSLTLLNIYLIGSRHSYGALEKPFWFPPLWLINVICLASSFVMGLSAWLVWAEGGFHARPTGFSLYLAQLGLSLAWLPTVFWVGASWVGLLVCLAMFGTQIGCSRDFREVNPIAGELVKPCLAWAAFLAIVNLKLVFL